MINRLNSLINIFDVGDLKFFYLVGKKNFKNLISLSIIISLLIFLISSNQEKKFLSKATIVIEPDDNKIVNILKLTAFSDPSLVQFMHRNLAYLILFFYFVIFIKIYKNKLINLYLPINIVGIFLIIQILLGILTLIYGAQIILASMHQGQYGISNPSMCIWPMRSCRRRSCNWFFESPHLHTA